MMIAVLEMVLPPGSEAEILGALRGVWDATCAQPGCVGGGVFQEVGEPRTALYLEMWEEAAQLEAHVRSRDYHRLLALMETAAEPPMLRFNEVGAVRGLAWVERVRLGAGGGEGGE
jgi:quinol monooxygenase YgiN